MMNHKDENANSSGLIVGFILGVASALLLSSKKGRKILKLLMDQGIDRLGNWEDVIKDAIEEEDDIIDGNDFDISPTIEEKKENKPDIKEVSQEPDASASFAVEDTTTAKVKKATRRFFRGIKKKI